MSVIGPRPGLWNQDILTAERDKYNANDVKPGLTGYEALVYAWLERNRIQYMPQYHVAREDCFKTSSQGYDIRRCCLGC